MLINDGLTPSNVGAGYVLRMIIRRGYYNLFLLRKMMKPELEHFIDQAFVAFKGLRDFNEPMIKKVLLQEIAQFEKTIHNGEKILTELLDKLTAEGKKTLGGDQIFMLYDTYGFPVDIVRDAAIPAFEKNVGDAYTAKIGYAPSFYVANIADGARRLS